MLEGFTGFQIALCCSRARSRDPHSIHFDSCAGNFQALTVKGLGIWLEAGADEWMVEFTGILADGCANLCAFFT